MTGRQLASQYSQAVEELFWQPCSRANAFPYAPPKNNNKNYSQAEELVTDILLCWLPHIHVSYLHVEVVDSHIHRIYPFRDINVVLCDS